MTEVRGRKLRAPAIQYNNQPGNEFNSCVDPKELGFWAWGARKALESYKIEWWGICDYSDGLLKPYERKLFREKLYRYGMVKQQ